MENIISNCVRDFINQMKWCKAIITTQDTFMCFLFTNLFSQMLNIDQL